MHSKKPGGFVYFILFLAHLYFLIFKNLFKNHFCVMSYSFWTCGFSQKGPINSASSVRLFIRNTDISGSMCQKFLIFCTKLEQHKCRKVMFSDHPCGWGQKVKFGLKLDFKDCFRTACQNFSIFCMKLDSNKAFQTMYMLSSGKLLISPSRGQKVKFWAQN